MARRVAPRSNSRPRRRVRDPEVVKAYWELWHGLPCEWGVLVGERCRGEELNHILSGSSKEDAVWNFMIMCAFHHRDNVHGFHGAEGSVMRERMLQAKLEQGFILPREAYRYLECGIDGAPDVEVDVEHNFRMAQSRAADLMGDMWR